MLHQGSHAFPCIHVATHACFLHFYMFDIAEHPKRTLRKMSPGGSNCLVCVRAHGARSSTFAAAPLHCQLTLLICFPNGSVPWPASTRHRQMNTQSAMLSPILYRVTTVQVFSPHIQHFRGILKPTRDQPACRRTEKRIVSTGSTSITVAVSYGCFPLRKQYRYDQKYYRNNSARADFCSSLRQTIRALQHGAVQSKNNSATARC